MKIVAIVLTYNEEKHIQRCIKNLKSSNIEVIVVDSFSTDETRSICAAENVKFYQNSFVTHSQQFNWALTSLDLNKYQYVLRIDADEYLSNEMSKYLNDTSLTLDGYYINRRVVFNGKLLRFGGMSNVFILRLFKVGKAVCDERLMDERMIVQGSTGRLPGSIIDENLNDLDWYIKKHLRYAQLECESHLNDINSSYLRDRIYYKFPNYFRAVLYFIFRYVLKLGFLDGNAGFYFHFLQGLFYRLMVDYYINIKCKLD